MIGTGTRCKVIRNLNRILVLDPEKPNKEKWGCYEHLINYIKELTNDISFKTDQIKYLRHQIQESDKLAILYKKMNDGSGYDYEESKKHDKKKQDLLDKLNQEIKQLRNFTCRDPLCRQQVTTSDFKCCIEIRSHYNTPRENLYFHRPCLERQKGVLGFPMPILKGQKTFEML